ncbi:hypothetical protein Smp_163440 [Schistosoma mansoni]|uniref:hypothetical protein n=1 Tax=Schistosoma mansoni TaxID=6183 RepID=UPI00022DC8FC|nr:hypothetical protein Smp_163440 [Schistosoma mansoni]|eukprot:XP_018647800.1 hypothetical protein Smp_163440 [Schistosoma mansoni]
MPLITEAYPVGSLVSVKTESFLGLPKLRSDIKSNYIKAEYELHAVGGPSQTLLEFIPESILSRTVIVKTNPSSVLLRASGSLSLANTRARVVGMTGNKLSSSLDEKRGAYVIYSETFCKIHTVASSGVRIRCPLANLDEITPQISDSSNAHLSELSNSDRSDRHFLLACPPGRSGDCGSTQLWVKSISNIVSPLGMAVVNLPLRFSWHLNPPEPNSIVRLEYWLD